MVYSGEVSLKFLGGVMSEANDTPARGWYRSTPSVPKLLHVSGEMPEFSPAKTSFNGRRYT
jgi:hypothetical protein